MMNYWGYGYDHMGYFPFGDVLSIIFTILLVLLVFAIFRRLIWGRRHGFWCRHCRYSDGAGMDKGAVEILKERYAKGEIKKEEFEQMKKDLES